MEAARRRNPFDVTPVNQDLVKDYSSHLSQYFKKSLRSGKKVFSIRKARILDYSSAHPTQVWVKYGAEEEEWAKFDVEKKGATATLPSKPRYTRLLPVKPAKLRDVVKLVRKYVPSEHHPFYDALVGDDEVSSETDEGEEDRDSVFFNRRPVFQLSS